MSPISTDKCTSKVPLCSYKTIGFDRKFNAKVDIFKEIEYQRIEYRKCSNIVVKRLSKICVSAILVQQKYLLQKFLEKKKQFFKTKLKA